jgi:glycosyltransferase involved in cell wall biosynthesis
VIIPAYNAAAFVGATVESVLAHTCAPAEIIVVDDGSTDDTVAALGTYGSAITVVCQPNGGPGRARNTGVARSVSEYVAFLDSDDLWEPERLARCLALLQEDSRVQIAAADAHLLYDDTRSDKVMYGDLYPADFPEPDRQLAKIAHANFLPSSIVLPRTLFDQVGGYDEDRALISSEDYELNMRLLLAGARAGLIREPLGWYRLRGDSLSANAAANWTSHLLAVERNLPALRAHHVDVPGSVVFELSRRAAEAGRAGASVSHAFTGLRSRDLPVSRRARAFLSSLVKSIPAALRTRPAA